LLCPWHECLEWIGGGHRFERFLWVERDIRDTIETGYAALKRRVIVSA
jgi:hypothetical protein